MAITRPVLAGPGLYPIEAYVPWTVNYHSADVTIAGVSQELKATPGDGKALYVTHVTMGIVKNAGFGVIVDNTITLKDGDGAVLFGPIQLQVAGGLFKKDWPEDAPLKLTDNKALDVAVARKVGTYDTAALVYVEGFTATAPIV